MNHLALARVWQALGTHIDTSNILREILSRYELSIAGQLEHHVREYTAQFLTWLAAFFDLQRVKAISQATEERNFLVHPDLQLRTLLYVSQRLDWA